MKSRYRTWQFAAALAFIAALILISVAAWANGEKKMPKVSPTHKSVSQPAVMGRGPTTVTVTNLSASSAGSCAWIYTSSPTKCAPMAVSGLIQATATVGPVGDTPVKFNDRANVVATFCYPANGSTYMVNFMSLASAGQFNTPFGGIVFERSIFGDTQLFSLDLPPTVAYVAMLGIATITKDNNVIASNQPAVVAITQAIHDDSHRLLAQADSSRKEMHLIVPGSFAEGVAGVPGFPNGGFYIYWPTAQYDIQRENITVRETLATPMGKGPEGVVGSLLVNLTSSGINKTVGTAPFGLYDITVRNMSNKDQGLFMTGTDLCCTEFKRFSTILKPGASQTFRFYFAPGKVVMRPFCCAVKTSTSYIGQSWTGPATSVIFQ
ncbi:MAG: hypothetical protein ABFD49_10660 [Armatimonadota bacterium]|nr:hypothetical protein [bacterium]